MDSNSSPYSYKTQVTGVNERERGLYSTNMSTIINNNENNIFLIIAPFSQRMPSAKTRKQKKMGCRGFLKEMMLIKFLNGRGR